MATARSKKASAELKVAEAASKVADELEEELDDIEEEGPDEEPTPTDGPVERDEYTAKQIATRLGVDAKVLRKFFRDPISTVEPCGQGGRYVFDAADLPKIKAEFEKYNSTKKPRGRQPAGEGTTKTSTRSKGRQAPAAAAVIAEDDELLDLDDIDDEPTLDDLEELDGDPDLDTIDELDEADDIEEADDDDIEEE